MKQKYNVTVTESNGMLVIDNWTNFRDAKSNGILPYGVDCNLPTPTGCYFDQIIGILSFLLLISLFCLIVGHYKSKGAKREGFFTNKKTWVLISMMAYSLYLTIDYNFNSHSSNFIIYFNMLIRRYLNSLSMILAAYYFFSKAVKGFVFKVFWGRMIKVLLLCGVVLDLYIIGLFVF